MVFVFLTALRFSAVMVYTESGLSQSGAITDTELIVIFSHSFPLSLFWPCSSKEHSTCSLEPWEHTSDNVTGLIATNHMVGDGYGEGRNKERLEEVAKITNAHS